MNCHQPGGTAEDYDYTDYVTTINTGGVVPGNPGASLLNSYTNVGHEPTDMAEALTPAEKAAISQWINLGALNN